MLRLRTIRAVIAGPLAVAMFLVSLPLGAARAGLVTTDQVIDEAAVESGRAEITAFLARDDVRSEFLAMGIAPEEAERRVASMSDAEVMQVAERIGNLPAGQAQGISLVVILLLIIILIILI